MVLCEKLTVTVTKIDSCGVSISGLGGDESEAFLIIEILKQVKNYAE